jgi:hypothetical protein
MTEDEKKKAVVEAAATELSPDDALEAFERMTLKTLLEDAMMELRARLAKKQPLVIIYRVPCPCGKPECITKLAVSISPYTEIIYDSLRSKH